MDSGAGGTGSSGPRPTSRSHFSLWPGWSVWPTISSTSVAEAALVCAHDLRWIPSSQLSPGGGWGGSAFDQGKMERVQFIAAIEGGLIAFLWFNISPARFFMGDTGVMA